MFCGKEIADRRRVMRKWVFGSGAVDVDGVAVARQREAFVVLLRRVAHIFLANVVEYMACSLAIVMMMMSVGERGRENGRLIVLTREWLRRRTRRALGTSFRSTNSLRLTLSTTRLHGIYLYICI